MLQRHSFVALAVALGMLACGLPDAVIRQVGEAEQRLDREAQAVEERAERLEKLRQATGADTAFLIPYLERERWSERLVAARKELDHARELIAREVGPLVEADRSGDEEELRRQIMRVRASVDKARELSLEPAARIEFLTRVRDQAPELVAGSRRQMAQIETLMSELEGKTAAAMVDYPEKRDDLSGRMAPLRKQEQEAHEALAAASVELAGFEEGTADLAVLGDSTALVGDRADQLASAREALLQRTAELYRSYSKTLVDMKQKHVLEIGRTTWNEAYDFPREHEVKFQVEVPVETAEYFEAWGDKPIASASSFFGRRRLDVRIDQAMWDSLGLDYWDRVPGGDDAGEFWLGDGKITYYHRYLVVEGNESEEGDWVEVSEELFEEHEDDLGMDIVSKPYGAYEDEILTQAAPPGMAYVGNPKYGRWETAADGRRQWSWGQSFLFYYLVFGGGNRHYYRYNDWNHWRGGYRGRSAWYGRNVDRPIYGTYGSGTRGSARYAGSAYALGGGFRRADRSVRGAGPSGRGGGPGGRGK